MKRILSMVVIIVMASGYALAADYWHFGAGVRLTGVIPGDDYANALGGGVLLTFGDPDSRFTTQMDLDTWKVTYQKNGDYVLTSPPGQDSTFKKRDHQYSGLGFGFFEKYRTFDFSRFSNYLIGGAGAYFLDRKQEERLDFGGTAMKSFGFHSLIMLGGGLGFEGRLSEHFVSFIEGRYTFILSGDNLDKDLVNGYFGVRYVF